MTRSCMTSGLMGPSESIMWGTPHSLFNSLDREFHFNLDVCSTPELAKCDNYFTPEIDGLSQDWNGHRCWMNPPYGNEIGKWVRKASEIQDGIVVALLPNRSDTKWYKQYVEPCASEIRLISGRVKFEYAGIGGGEEGICTIPLTYCNMGNTTYSKIWSVCK